MGERDQPCCPVAAIGDAQGQMVADGRRVGRRWGGYFEGLLGPNGDSGDDGFSAQDILEREPEVLRSGVGGGGGSLKSAKTGKAPGVNGVGVEMVKAAGEAGVELLWRVSGAVWKDRVAPMEWGRSIIIPIMETEG